MVQYQISVWSPIQLDHRWQLGLNLTSQGCLKTSRGGHGVLLGFNQALLGTLYPVFQLIGCYECVQSGNPLCEAVKCLRLS